jgi:hypothetical protein
MRLLSLDFDPVFGDDTTRASFSGQDSVFDYDVVVWNPAVVARGYNFDSLGALSDLAPRLTENSSARITADVERRQAEFADFISMGRTLIVFAAPCDRINLYNRLKTVDVLKAIPGAELHFVGGAGT